ncbi:APC family permease [Blastopirellula marina]|uniref:Amino acid transporter n=1 Tax=Blastopirellula marina TaxID=124 RepID=A0A2S8F867_9BACT|nr:APC family permease [Blastopirellula marina]PQO28351.1 amino acid transporter [Blastopirellula marina]PTL41891.1 amino acid permease [Blastopirellula marina]
MSTPSKQPADRSPQHPQIGVIGAAAIGVGGMVGGGIFAVLGTAVALAGGGTPIAFLLAGAIALLTSYSYARLSVTFPSAGGTLVFLDKAFGVNLLTGTLNTTLWLSYLVTIALYAAAFGSYAATFFPDASPLLKQLFASLAILLPAAINLLNSDIISKSETIIVVIKLSLLALVIAAGIPHVEPARLQISTWADPLSLVMGGMVIFVAYEGFELIANAAEDVKTPAVTLPRAYLGCVVFVVALYVLVSIVTVGSVSSETIAQAKDYALAAAAKPSLGHTGFVLVSISALLATFSAINATIYGNARLGFSLAKDGDMPKLLEERVWSRPVAGVLLTTGLSLLLVNLIDLQAIAILGSAGFLVIFAFVNLAAFRLSKEAQANRWVVALAAAACLLALAALLLNTYQTDPKALLVFGGLLLSATLFELIYPRLAKRPERRLHQRFPSPQQDH